MGAKEPTPKPEGFKKPEAPPAPPSCNKECGGCHKKCEPREIVLVPDGNAKDCPSCNTKLMGVADAETPDTKIFYACETCKAVYGLTTLEFLGYIAVS